MQEEVSKDVISLLPKFISKQLNPNMTVKMLTEYISNKSDLQVFTSFDRHMMRAVLFFGGSPVYDPEYIRVYLREKAGIRRIITSETLPYVEPRKFPLKSSIRSKNNTESGFNHDKINTIVGKINTIDDKNKFMFRISSGGNMSVCFRNCDRIFINKTIHKFEGTKIRRYGRCIFKNVEFDLHIYDSIEDAVFSCGVDSRCAVLDPQTNLIHYNERFEYALRTKINTLNFELIDQNTEYDLIQELKNYSIYIPLYDKYKNLLQLGEFYGTQHGMREIRYWQLNEILNEDNTREIIGDISMDLQHYTYPDPISWFCPKSVVKSQEFEEYVKEYKIVKRNITIVQKSLITVLNKNPNIYLTGTFIAALGPYQKKLIIIANGETDFSKVWSDLIEEWLKNYSGGIYFNEENLDFFKSKENLYRSIDFM